MVFIHKNNLSKLKDGVCIKNLDEYESVGTCWIALYVNDHNVTCFDRLQVKVYKSIQIYFLLMVMKRMTKQY